MNLWCNVGAVCRGMLVAWPRSAVYWRLILLSEVAYLAHTHSLLRHGRARETKRSYYFQPNRRSERGHFYLIAHFLKRWKSSKNLFTISDCQPSLFNIQKTFKEIHTVLYPFKGLNSFRTRQKSTIILTSVIFIYTVYIMEWEAKLLI